MTTNFQVFLLLLVLVLAGCREHEGHGLAPTPQTPTNASLSGEALCSIFRTRASTTEWQEFQSGVSSSNQNARAKAQMMVLGKLTIDELHRAGITQIGTGDHTQWGVAACDDSDQESAKACDDVLRQLGVQTFAVGSHGTVGFYVPQADFTRVQMALLAAQQTQRLKLRVFGPRFDTP